MGSKIIKPGQIYPIATETILGRIASGSGEAAALSVSEVLTLLGADSHITLVGTSDAAELDITPFATQTNNQQVWRNTGGTVVSSIDASGRFTGGTGSFTISSTFNATLWNGGKFGWASSGSVNGTSTVDTALIRDGAAGAIAARNATTAHVLRVYNTYTSSTNYERGNIGFVSNVYTIGSYAAGAGTVRDIMIGVSGNKLGFFGTTAIAQPTTGYSAATFVANSGTAVTDASTFDGYTLKQVVAALRGLGFLA